MANDLQKAKDLASVGNFVSGTWREPKGPPILVESPYFGATIGQIRESTSEDVDVLVQSAHQAFLHWRDLPMKERAQVLFRFRELLLAQIDVVANMISLESGKTLGEARAEILKGVEVLEFALSLQNSDSGGRMEVSRGVSCEYRREPLGVVVNITPFNFPAMVPMWTIPIAIALGNSYVWKPSEKTPLTSKYLADLFHQAGLPPGVFQVAQGAQKTVEALIDHPLVKAIGFVGSSRVAKAVYVRGTQLGKRVLALGGAKNHIVLLPDADPQLTGRGISDSFTGCAGQRCMAASVVLAVKGSEPLIEKIVERASSIRLGEDMGAIITQAQLQFLHEAIGRAEKAGAQLLLDGRKIQPPKQYQNGFWLGPTILDQVDPQSEAARLELFGPILSIIRVGSISEAMEIENSNPYGNACSVFTRTGAFAEKVIRKASTGMVGVNVGVPVPREPFSFGGVNESKYGHGDITGAQSVDFWSDLKKVTTKWESQNDETWMS